MFKDERVPFLVRQNRVIIGNEGQPDASAWAERLGFPVKRMILQYVVG